MLMDVQSSGMPVQVDGLDDRIVLQLLRDAEEQEREAGRRKLRLALHWAETHAVDDPMTAAHWSDADLRDIEETIGGEGTPMVAASCVEELAGALMVSPRTAMHLMSDGIDLKYRLPRTRSAVEEQRLAPWRARQIARMTRSLSPEAAAYVDARLAPIAESCGPVRIQRYVDEATARFDPESQAAVEDEAKAAWGVKLETYTGPVWGGTSRLEVIGDTPTLNRFFGILGAQAHDQLDATLPADQQPSIEHRKVAALGLIADGAGATSKTTAYLHLDAEAVTKLPDALVKIGTVEKLGPLTVATIREWLGSSRFTLQPVLDLSRCDGVDQHDPPDWMRELVILRDGTCVHPNCDRPARECDLDHIEAYVAMDDGGPPGQTRPDNLAPLCRRHHRAKTHFGWSYQRNSDGSYTWTSPRGARCTVDVRGIVTEH